MFEHINWELDSYVLAVIVGSIGLIRGLFSLVIAGHKTYKTIMKLDSELSFNGGKSLKDFVVATKTSVEILSEEQEKRYKFIIEQLLKLDGRQRIVFNQHQCGIFETDAKGNCTWVNQKYMELTGKLREELEGDGWLTIIDEGERERVFREWERAAKSHSYFEMSLTYIHPQNGTIPVLCKAWPLKSDENLLLGFVGIVCKEGERHEEHFTKH